MSRKADGVGFGLVEEVGVVGDGLGGIYNDDSAFLVNFFDYIFDV